MDGLSQNALFLTVSGNIIASGDVRLKSLRLTSLLASPLGWRQVAAGIGCVLIRWSWPKSCCVQPNDGRITGISFYTSFQDCALRISNRVVI